MRELGAGISDVARLAAAIAANGIVREHISLNFLGQSYEAPAENLIALVLSASIILILSQFLLARPAVEVLWRNDDERVAEPGPALTIKFRETDPPTLWDVQVRYHRRSALAWGISRIIAHAKLAFSVELQHKNAVKLSIERASRTAVGVRAARQKISFPLLDGGLADGAASWALISVVPSRVPADLVVKCKYTLRGTARWHALLRLLTRVDASVRELRLVRIN